MVDLVDAHLLLYLPMRQNWDTDHGPGRYLSSFMPEGHRKEDEDKGYQPFFVIHNHLVQILISTLSNISLSNCL